MKLHLAGRVLPAGVLAVAIGTAFSATATAQGDSAAGSSASGHVYEATNSAVGNEIQVFDVAADGRLTASGLVPTGGRGTGASLHSQGAVTRVGSLLFVVNGGSNSVSTLRITDHGLVLRDTLSTTGTLPVSVTARDGVGYVVNQGSDTITGFRYGSDGWLTSLAGSVRSLTPNPAGGITDAAQISFTPDGASLLVTEKASNTLDTFPLDGAFARRAVPHVSSGVTPYGFDFDVRGHAVVSEAGSGTVSSYRVRPRAIDAISPSVSDTQAAACWLAVSRKDGYAWAVNAASGTVSSYRVARDGSLTLLDAVAATTGAGGTDVALSTDGRSLHVRLAAGLVSSWAIGDGGSLTSLGTTQGAPAFGTAGLATS